MCTHQQMASGKKTHIFTESRTDTSDLKLYSHHNQYLEAERSGLFFLSQNWTTIQNLHTELKLYSDLAALSAFYSSNASVLRSPLGPRSVHLHCYPEVSQK